MDRTTKIKEAIKTGLAFALVFGLAMQFGWMNPYWAGWAVAVIALPTTGESLRKGALRVLGTIPGCLAALVINALAPQERWTFLLLTCGWVFLTSYLMVSSKKYSYVWVMAAYVCLIILQPDADSSENMFESAVFRTVETAMGVVVYTLIAVFLWPRTNLGAIKRSSADLAAALNELYRARAGSDAPPRRRLRRTCRGSKPRCSSNWPDSEKPSRPRDRRATRSARTVICGSASKRWALLFRRPSPGGNRVWPSWNALNCPRFSPNCRPSSPNSMLVWLSWPQCSPAGPWVTSRARSAWSLNPSRWDACPVLIAPRWRSPERRWTELEALTAALLECALQLAGHPATAPQPKPLPISSRPRRTTLLPVPDWEDLRCAAYVTATTAVGFLIWILFDPPGHSGWFQAGGSLP